MKEIGQRTFCARVWFRPQSFFHGETYYAIHPSGEGQKKLFHKPRAVSALFWSPDSRFVAYVHRDFFALDVEFYGPHGPQLLEQIKPDASRKIRRERTTNLKVEAWPTGFG